MNNSGSLVTTERQLVIPPEQGGVRLVASRHPFKLHDRVDLELPEGLSLQEMFELAQPDPVLRRHAVVYLEDEAIPRENWRLIRPKSGATITIRIMAHGGFGGGGGDGGKSPLSALLSIVVIAATLVATFYLGPMAGFLVSTLGGLLMSSLSGSQSPKLPGLSGQLGSPSARSRRESPTLFIEGARNEARPFDVVPQPLGRVRMVPPFGALPYTEIFLSDGGTDQQYLRMLFVWGRGPHALEQERIGTTDLDEFEGVERAFRPGYQDDPPLSIYTDDVFEEDFEVLLNNEVGDVVRNTEDDADEVSVDITFRRGLVTFADDGNRNNRTVEVSLTYAPVGSSTFVGGGGTFAARNSPQMPVETGTKPMQVPDGNGGFTTQQVAVENPQRVDLVVIAKGTGDIKVIPGATVSGDGTPIEPKARTSQVPLAAVRRTTTTNITASDITDRRPSNPPFSSSSDFAVSPTSPESDEVEVAGGTLDSLSFVVTAAKSEAVRRSAIFEVPTRGQYQVKLRRVTADTDSTKVLDEVTFTALRTITLRSPLLDATGFCTTELRIQASEQLQRVIERYNAIITPIAPDWDSGSATWVAREITNPASIYRYILQGPGNLRPLPDDRLDLDSIQEFHERCTNQNFAFAMVRDFPASVHETMVDVCSAGMGAPLDIDGRWGVVWEAPDKPIVQKITPRNSFNFAWEHTYPEETHAWVIRFQNEEEDYQQDELVVYNDGHDESTATKYEDLEIIGVTNPEQIRVIGRRRIVEAENRRERYQVSMDPEHLVVTRGDHVLLAHDVISIGIVSARVLSVTKDGGGDVTGVRIDEPVAMAAGTDYGLSIRLPKSQSTPVDVEVIAEVAFQAGDAIQDLTFVTPVPAVNAPEVDSLVTFGERERETEDALVTSIVGLDDLGARLRLVPYSQPTIENAAEADFTPFTPNVTAPAGTFVPFVTGVQSDESVLRVLPSGLLEPQMVITIGRPSSTVLDRVQSIEVEYRPVGSGDQYKSLSTQRQNLLQVTVPGLEQGVVYEFRLRYIFNTEEGAYSNRYTHIVVGMATPPPDVLTLVMEDGVLKWTYGERPVDFRGFMVRHSTDLAANWDAAFPAHDGVVSTTEFDVANLPRGQRVFLVKAMDQASNVSTNARRLVRDLGDIIVDNVVVTHDYAALSFPGTLTGGTVVGDDIVADSTTAFLPNDGAFFAASDSDPFLPDEHGEVVYTTGQLQVDESWGPSRLTASLDVDNAYILQYDTGVDPLFAEDGNAAFADPDGDEFAPILFEENYRSFPASLEVVEGDAFVFRLTVDAGISQGRVRDFYLVFDVPDELETIEDLSVPSEGTRLTLTKRYRSITNVSFTFQDDGGDAVRVDVVDKGLVQDGEVVLGPAIQSLDGAGAGTSSLLDVTVQGVMR